MISYFIFVYFKLDFGHSSLLISPDDASYFDSYVCAFSLASQRTAHKTNVLCNDCNDTAL